MSPHCSLCLQYWLLRSMFHLVIHASVAHCCEQMNSNLFIMFWLHLTFSLIFLLGIACIFKVLFLGSIVLLILSTLYETDYSHSSSSNIFQLYPRFPQLQVISSCYISESSRKAFITSKSLSWLTRLGFLLIFSTLYYFLYILICC